MSTNAFQNILKLSFDKWFMANLGQKRQNKETRNWNALFAITLWWLWKWRNDFVFNDKRLDVNLKVKQLKNQLNEIKSAFSSSRVMPSHTQRYANCIVRWIPTPEGWCSLVVDGSCKQSIRKAGGGGLLRNEYGDWMIDFMHNIGWCSIEEAELWAAYKGLQLAWEAGQRKIMLGIDSIEVIKWLNNKGMPCSSLINLISLYASLLARKWEVKIQHIYREQNKVADFLAAEALKMERGYKTMWTPPVGLHAIIQEDKAGFGSCRRIVVQ